MDLTDEQWALLEPLLPKIPRRADGKGRPRRDAREVMNGIMWVLRTGAPWEDLPKRYPPYQTCHRRFQEWVNVGAMEKVLCGLATHLKQRGGIDLSEAFIDGTFSPAKKGVFASAKPSGARGPRSWPLQTALVFLSPYPLQVLRRMKSRLSSLP